MTVQLSSWCDNACTGLLLGTVKVHLNAYWTFAEVIGALRKAKPKNPITSCSLTEIENMGD